MSDTPTAAVRAAEVVGRLLADSKLEMAVTETGHLADVMRVNVRSCQRCGEDHDGIPFASLANPADDYARWGMCPTTDQPVLLAVREAAEPAAPVPLRQPIPPGADPVPAAAVNADAEPTPLVDAETGEPIDPVTLKPKLPPRPTMTVAGNYKTGELVLVFSEPVDHAAIPLGQVRDLVETIRREANNLRRLELAEDGPELRPRTPKSRRRGGRR